ncbi:hypothetical protein GQ53DRAFT_639773, partial [Thozetella sp. PMI_491]
MNAGSEDHRHAVFNLSFLTTEVAAASDSCQCWYELLRAPVIAQGFPIPKRPISETGLEVPLNVMAQLVGTHRVNSFGGKMFIKGFAAMLVPTKLCGDVLVWHLLADPDEGRISYLDTMSDHSSQVTLADLTRRRHIVGWCSDAEYRAGIQKATYAVEKSRLPRPHASCVLSKCSISGGMNITGGVEFTIATRNKPLRLTHGTYPEKLEWISKKFVVFWDEADRRGWLVNGTAALLHLARASPEYNKSSDIFAPLLM